MNKTFDVVDVVDEVDVVNEVDVDVNNLSTFKFCSKGFEL